MDHLNLFYPEWQSYGVDRRAADGARLLHRALPDAARFTEVTIDPGEQLCSKSGILGPDAIPNNSAAARDIVGAARPDTIFMVGGTCGAELAPVAYLNQRYAGDLALLWFDAHGDLNTPASSTSGHFHGMVLRMLLGEGDPDLLNFVPLPLRPGQVTLAGTRDLDPPEADYIRRTGLVTLDPDTLADPGAILAAARRSAAANLYIHLDVDFFNPVDVPDLLVPTPGGITLDALAPIIGALAASFNIVATSVVEFVPGDPDSAARIASFLAQSGLHPSP
jgi:arginase